MNPEMITNIQRKEMINTLRLASEKIRRLQRENELMGARLSGFDDAMRLLSSSERLTTQGFEECAASMCEKLARELDIKEGIKK